LAIADFRLGFERFVHRKQAEAARAEILPLRTEIDCPPPDVAAIGNDWTRSMFDGDFYVSRATRALPSTSLVFVQSKDGNTGAPNPSALGGGEADTHLIYEGLSRVAADAVMAGAQTIRGGTIVLSVWHPELVRLRAALGLPRHPIQIIATLRGLPFDESLILNVPELRVLLVTIPSWVALMHDYLAARPWITPIVMETPADLPHAMRRIHALGIARISCIGGRTLARQLLDAGLVDDLYLTTSATIGGEPNTPLSVQPLDGRTIVRKTGTGDDTGVVFEHVVFPSCPPSGGPTRRT
jgi:5-amino-6-(5-phosphoribosylamino)uracil reductase